MWAMGITEIVVIFMAIIRDILRTAYLSPYFKAGELATKTQLDVLILFLVMFVIGILVWVLMIKRYFLHLQQKLRSDNVSPSINKKERGAFHLPEVEKTAKNF